jgi:two-component system, LytTR family, sensor kinase
MNLSNAKKFLYRTLVLYFLSLVIKGFDLSFGGITDFTIRGQLFSIYLTFFWLGVWYLSVIIDEGIRHYKAALRYIIHFALAFIASFIFNWGYRFADDIIYNNSNLWHETGFFNPPLTIGFSIIYILIYGFNDYFRLTLKLKEEQLKAEKLLKENTLAQFMSLKAQIGPHFLFNSLSVLSSLIYNNQELAGEFIKRLSATLRYLIEKNDQPLVPLAEEIRIVDDYFFLMKTRFEKGIFLTKQIPEDYCEKFFVPPVSIQILIENAINHNKHSEEKPLQIALVANDGLIRVSNNIQRKNPEHPTTGKGLANLRERYALLGSKEIKIEQTCQEFAVSIPLLKKESYEHFDH